MPAGGRWKAGNFEIAESVAPEKSAGDMTGPGQGRERWRRMAIRALVVTWGACGLLGAGRPSADRPPPGAAAEARQRIENLRAEIARHDRLYFAEAAPEISDYAYDQLVRELARLEAAFPDGRPGASIGDDRTGLFPTWRHRRPMQSLEKTYDEGELRSFLRVLARRLGAEELMWTVEPKVDGLAVSAIYERGRLVRIVTRGDGREGDDISRHIGGIRSLPRGLRRTMPDGRPNPIPDLIELRGEIYVSWAEFDRVNRERRRADEAPFAHPRNLAAGTVRLLDESTVETRNLDVVFYGWGAWEPEPMRAATQQAFHEQVRAWGLPGLADYRAVRGADEVWAAVRDLQLRRAGLPFPVDGVVVKLDAVSRRAAVGESDHAPRWAMAFKFAPARVATRLRAITVQVGRTGLLTPVAELAPVHLAGGIVSRATLHNGPAVARRDLRVGDLVYVERAGGVIPEITGVELAQRPAESRPYEFPTSCPVCGTAVVRLEGEAATRCPNATCPAQVRQRLRHFTSRACLDIGGLGPATIDRLVGCGVVATVADLYRLDRRRLVAVGGLSAEAADTVLAAVERSKRAELSRFIHGLGIPTVGAVAARELARRFGSLDALAAASPEDFAAGSGRRGDGVSNRIAQAVIAHFRLPRNRSVVGELLAWGVRPDARAGGGARARR